MEIKTKMDLSTTTPLLPQESNEVEDKKKFLCYIHSNLIAQTASLTNICRIIAGAIIATIWAICYKDENVDTPNICLRISIIISFCYFFAEFLHYFTDSIFYFRKSKSLEKKEGIYDIETEWNKVKSHSNCSFIFLMIKAIITAVLSILFILGIYLL